MAEIGIEMKPRDEGEPKAEVCGQISFTTQTAQSAQVHIKNLTEIDLLSSLLTDPQSKELVIFGEENFTFELALATVRGNSWDGIHHGVHKFEEKKLKSIELCSQLGRQTGASEIDILKKIQDMLKTPSPPPDVQGKVVWYQFPWSNPGPTIKEVINEMKDKQKPKDYLLFGILGGAQGSSSRDYGILEVNQGRVRKDMASYRQSIAFQYGGTDYAFIGADKKFVEMLVSYGYSNHGYANDHLTLVFQKKPLTA